MIAPLLGPVIALAFASVLGDFRMAFRSFVTTVDMYDLVLALSAGAAGAISMLKRFSGALVGVMVSVALLPPVVVLGMTLGAAMWYEAYEAMLLLFVNISSILLSAVIVFIISGIRPVEQEQAERAFVSRMYALLLIGVIVLLLVLAMIYSHPWSYTAEPDAVIRTGYDHEIIFRQAWRDPSAILGTYRGVGKHQLKRLQEMERET